MPTARNRAKPAAPADRKTTAAPARRRRPDAFALLKADHAEVKKCFQAYAKLAKAQAGGSQRRPLAEQICLLLTVHATIEEEIFYPAARAALPGDAELIDEAGVEHASAKDLIAQIRAMQADEHLYDAKVKVLGDYIAHHVKEEQDSLFPKVKRAGIDRRAVGEALAVRKVALTNEMLEGSEPA